jgi:hypothetical protein
MSKWMDLGRFAGDMNNQPFPHWMAAILTWSLPVVDIFIPLALIINRTRPAGLWASLIVMSLFTIYAGVILFHFFDRVPCGCGGVIRGLTWPQHLFFNLFFTLVSLSGILMSMKGSKKEEQDSITAINTDLDKIFHA